MIKFILTEKDKLILSAIGVPNEDFKQIENASNMCEIEVTYKDKRNISYKRKSSINGAIKHLGRKEVLCALDRAAFHWTSARHSDDGRYYFFDCSRYFRGYKRLCAH